MHSCSWQDQLRSSSAELDPVNRSKRVEWNGVVDSPDLTCTLSSKSSPEHCDLDIDDQYQHDHSSALLKTAERSGSAGEAADQMVTPPPVVNGRFVLSDDGQVGQPGP